MAVTDIGIFAGTVSADMPPGIDSIHEVYLATVSSVRAAVEWIRQPPEFGSVLRKGQFLVARAGVTEQGRVEAFGRVTMLPRKKGGPLQVAVATTTGVWIGTNRSDDERPVGVPKYPVPKVAYTLNWQEFWRDSASAASMFQVINWISVPNVPRVEIICSVIELHARVSPEHRPMLLAGVSAVRARVRGEEFDPSHWRRVLEDVEAFDVEPKPSKVGGMRYQTPDQRAALSLRHLMRAFGDDRQENVRQVIEAQGVANIIGLADYMVRDAIREHIALPQLLLSGAIYAELRRSSRAR